MRARQREWCSYCLQMPCTVEGRAQMSLLDIPFQMLSCTPHARRIFSVIPSDPGCYFLRSSYKVPVHFPLTLFPRPPHRECVTHRSSEPLKKEKKYIKKYKITKTSKNNYMIKPNNFFKRACFLFLKDKVSIYPDVSEASSSRADSCAVAVIAAVHLENSVKV